MGIRLKATAIAFALDDDLVSVVGESVESALSEEGVFEQRDPFLNGTIGSENGGRASVSFQDELIDIGGLEGVHTSEGEVVNDE